jgi:hypothetical protein
MAFDTGLGFLLALTLYREARILLETILPL